MIETVNNETLLYIRKLIEKEQKALEYEPGVVSTSPSSLRCYYGTRISNGSKAPDLEFYSGAYFDRFPGEEDRAPNRFLPEDVLAPTLLSTKIPSNALVGLLYTESERFNEQLAAIPHTRDGRTLDFFDATEEDLEIAFLLEKSLTEFNGIGATRASKLIAHKRPFLYPIYDSVVNNNLFEERNKQQGGKFTLPLHRILTANRDIKSKLENLRDSAGLPDTISPIRILDILVWMDGRIKSKST